MQVPVGGHRAEALGGVHHALGRTSRHTEPTVSARFVGLFVPAAGYRFLLPPRVSEANSNPKFAGVPFYRVLTRYTATGGGPHRNWVRFVDFEVLATEPPAAYLRPRAVGLREQWLRSSPEAMAGDFPSAFCEGPLSFEMNW
jgi:hypothetical protein